jgi:hypothetical protein
MLRASVPAMPLNVSRRDASLPSGLRSPHAGEADGFADLAGLILYRQVVTTLADFGQYFAGLGDELVVAREHTLRPTVRVAVVFVGDRRRAVINHSQLVGLSPNAKSGSNADCFGVTDYLGREPTSAETQAVYRAARTLVARGLIRKGRFGAEYWKPN